MAATWDWHARNRRDFWERVRTIARDVGEPIVKVLEIPGAFIPGASTALKKTAVLFSSGLNISELDSAEVLEPLAGAPGPFASTDGKSPVFINGVIATMTAAHDAQGSEQISVERIDLALLDYDGRQLQQFSKGFDANRVFGAGLIEPQLFMVEIDSGGPRRARRIVRAEGSKSSVVQAFSANFLDTDPASFFALSKSDPPVVLRFAIVARSPGMYAVCLRTFYRVAGRELRQHTSLPVVIYRHA